MPVITWNEILAMLTRIASEYCKRGVDRMTPDGDFYVSLSTGEMFDVYSEPSRPLAIGSIDDDWRELKRLIADPEHLATAVDVERLGNVLRALSETIAPSVPTCTGDDT